MPLRLVFNRNTYLLNSTWNADVLVSTIHTWLAAGDRVFFMNPSELSPDMIRDLQQRYRLNLHRATNDAPLFPMLRNTIESKPVHRSAHRFEYWIYEVTDPDDATGGRKTTPAI